MTEMDAEKLRALYEAATKGDLSTAERHIEHEHIECPVCQGDGEVLATDYCNIDGKALGVQFYGIGNEFGAHEALWAYLVSTVPSILALTEERDRLKLEIEAKDCLMDGHYKAGVKAGWNMAIADDYAGLMRITDDTSHIAELKRIRAALTTSSTEKGEGE